MAESAERNVIFRMRAEPQKGALEKVRKFGSAIEQAEKRVASTRERHLRDAQRNFQRAIDERLRLHRKETDAGTRAVDAVERAEKKAHRLHLQRAETQATKDRQLRQQAIREHERALQAQERSVSQAVGRIKGANAVLQEGITSTGESLVRMAGGLATLGIVGEENNAKLLRMLVTLRGINDSLTGGINLFIRTQKVVEGYRETLAAVEALNTSIAAKQALAGAGGQFAGSAVGGAASRGAARRGGAEAAGNFAAAAAGSQLSGLQKIVLRTTSSLRTLGAAASRASGPLAAIAGIAALGDVAYSGSMTPRAGSMREKVVGGQGSLMSFFPSMLTRIMPERMLQAGQQLNEIPGASYVNVGLPFAGAELSRRAAGRGEERLQKELEQEQRRFEMLRARLGEEAIRTQMAIQPAISQADRLSGDAALPAIDTAQKAIDERRRQIESLDVNARGNPELQVQKLEMLLDLDQRSVELAEQKKDIEEETLRIRREGAEADIRSTEQALQNTQQRIKALQQQFLSAEERFGQLSKEEQDEILRVGRKAKADPLSLTREERATLRRAGTEFATETAAKGDIAASRDTAFRDVFLAEKQKRVAAVQKAEEELKVKLEDQRSLVVEVDQDIQSLVEVMREEMAKRDERLIETFKAELEADREARARQNDMRRANTTG